MSTPIVPPRPARAQAGPTAVKQDMPFIPPRPVRKTDPSPDREAYTRSPLYNLPGATGGLGRPPPTPSRSPELARRAPSIALPNEVGQEGFEYTSYDQLPPEAKISKDAVADPQQLRNVSADVPLHAPKASVPQVTATNRIATVTRTDSTQAAAAGIGKARPDDDVHKTPAESSTNPLSRVTSRTYDDHLRRVPSTEPHPLRAAASFNRSSTSLASGTPRPPSIQGEHHEGIPEIGMQIPLYKNAGDVQAPSPAPTQSQHTPGIGFFNDGSSRNHHRKRSSRQEFGPPGSYGMHGHGLAPQDAFEREWIAKHPELAAQEGYSTFTPRPATALTPEQLIKLVHTDDDVGMGTNRNMIGTPSQDIAFEATDQWAQRMFLPRPSATGVPLSGMKKRSSSGHQPPIESPLRKAIVPDDENAVPDSALEAEDDGVIHVMPNARRGDKITGGGAMDGAVDLGPTGGNTEEKGGYYDERGYGIPILASDEIIRRPGSAYQQPAVDPETERKDDDYYDSDHGRRASWQPPSRPSSRPGSIHGAYHGGPIHRFISHDEHHGSGMGTPLEEIEEYEPLFPEDGGEEKPKPKFAKRPGLAQHHFPSQDIWEDTPSSLQYQTTVDTPEPPPEKIVEADGAPAKVFETPEQEQRRKDNNTEDMLSDNKTFAKPHFKPGVAEELHDRPGLQRFPSRDIWEDTPSSLYLSTTVSGPQMDDVRSPPEDRPTTSALPDSQDDGAARSTTGMSQIMKPSVPARPERKSKLAQEVTPDTPAQSSQEEDPRAQEVPDLGSAPIPTSPDKAKAPAIPDRPKPSVPARPARFSHSDQTDGAGAPLAKSVSAASAGSDASVATDGVTSPPLPKAKPAVPARPGGGKIAALKAGFMNDLNSRLQLGPQAPPSKSREFEPEAAEETEKAPLADARKGRAKGPARRKPAADSASTLGGFSFSIPTTLWHIDERDELNVPSLSPAPIDTTAAGTSDPPAMAEVEKVLSANSASNTEEPALTSPTDGTATEPSVEAKISSPPTTAAGAFAGDDDSSHPASLSAHAPGAIGAQGDEPEPTISAATAKQQAHVQEGFEAALADSEAHAGERPAMGIESTKGQGLGVVSETRDAVGGMEGGVRGSGEEAAEEREHGIVSERIV